MLTAKKYSHLITVFCFLAVSSSFHYLWAKETPKNTTPDKQKAEEKQEKAPKQDQPQISLNSTKYDAGEVYEGDVIIHDFTVKNTGTAQLNIEKVKAGWGCTVASFDKAISPGQEGKVTLKVDTNNKRGRLSQSANIFSNDPQNPKTKIAIMGSIKHYISVTPSTRLLLQGYPGDKITKKVTITSHEEQPLKITDITSTIDDKIEYNLKPIEKGKEFSFEIKTPLGIKESFKGKVTLKTNSQKKPKLELVVMGKVRSEVKVAPQSLSFGIINTQKETIDLESLKRTVVLSGVKGDDLILEKIEPGSDWIMTEAETDQKRKKHTIIIKLDKNKLPMGKFKQKIIIHTKYREISEAVVILIEGKVV